MKPVRDPFELTHRFTATLFHTGGKGGWTFAPLPKSLQLPVTGSWGMTPVMASVDGKTLSSVSEQEAETRLVLFLACCPPSGRIHCCWTEPLGALDSLIGVCIGRLLPSVGSHPLPWAGWLDCQPLPRRVCGCYGD